MRCNYAEPMRVGMRSLPARVGLAEKAPRARLAGATVATFVAMLQARYYAGVAGVAAVAKSTITPSGESFSVTGGVR